MNSNTRLAWGIIGTGSIAQTFARSILESQTGRFVAVASRTQTAADDFAGKYPGTRPHGSYEALLADPDVEAVYISTPHPMHLEWVIRAARAGKHILCEKPIGMNHAEAMAAAEAARQNGVFLMEAFMYRCHPQTATIVEIVRSGQLGEVRAIEAIFGWDCGSFQPESRLFKNELGGGAILDVGCYCMSMARLVAGAALGQPFAEPTRLKAVGHLAESGVDDITQALLTFPGDIQARLHTATRLNIGASVTVMGSEATLRVPSPWFCGHPTTHLEIRKGDRTETIEVSSEAPLYALEIDAVSRSLEAGETPAMPIDDTVGNMAALDWWRTEIGVAYDSDKVGASRPRLPGLRRSPARPIPHLYRPIPGLDPDKPASRMVLGTMLEGTNCPAPHAFALFDYFFEFGGNIFDTAHIYAGGDGERTLGSWLRQRGVRDQVHLIVKGAHTPWCNPADLLAQFNESMERLQIEKADIYMLHRDNLEIPVGEFVDVLNQQVRAGRIALFGGSNWSIERIEQANAYARQHGLQGFGAVSNQFSLARMVNPVWDGCVSNSSVEARSWHAQTGIPLFAWSSQARGFFVRASRDDLSDPELVHTWYSDDNFARLERVRKLARQKKTEPVNIAAAYVLQQSFPVFALIGPRRLSEIASSFQAFEVTLTPDEMAWLNLETEKPGL